MLLHVDIVVVVVEDIVLMVAAVVVEGTMTTVVADDDVTTVAAGGGVAGTGAGAGDVEDVISEARSSLALSKSNRCSSGRPAPMTSWASSPCGGGLVTALDGDGTPEP